MKVKRLIPSSTAIGVFAASGLLAPAEVLAQQAAAAEPANSDGLQTVMVSAQKRAEPLQKTAVSVNVVDSRALETQRIVAFDDLTRVAPAMTVTQNGTNSSVALRGIGTQSVSIGVESAVSIIIDDVPVVQQMQAFSNLSDIDRIEVLRGPQGTLFGKNASAGVINIATKESTEALSGSVQLTGTSDHERRAEASLSGPISDSLRYRLNAYTSKRRGYIHNLTTGHDLNGEDAKGLRVRLDANPSSRLKLKLIADYAESSGLGPATPFTNVPAGSRLFGAVDVATALSGIHPSTGNYLVRLDEDGFFNSRQSTFSVAANYALDAHTLTSITSYQDWKYDYSQDTDTTDADLMGALTRGAIHGGLVNGGPYASHMLTQELRLTSTGSGPLTYLFGLYGTDSSSDRAFKRGPGSFSANWDATAKNTTAAAFTQAGYAFTPETRLTAGLRVNHQKIDVRFTNQLAAGAPTYLGNTSENATTGKIALQHDLAPAVMVFGSYSTGYKGSGYDISTGFNQAKADAPVRPETSKSYELGVKSRFLQNKVQLNAVAFLTNYDDFQAQSSVLDASTGLIALRLNNVGKLQTKGVELELTAKPNRNWMLESSLGFTDAVIKSFPTATCYLGQTAAQGCFAYGNGTAQNLAGKQLANAPRFKGNLGATYNFPVAHLNGALNLNYQYQSKVNFDLYQNPLTVQQDYSVLNGSVALRDDVQGWKLTVFGNNLLDRHYASFIQDGAGVFGGAHVLGATLSRNSRRYVGVRLKYEF